MPVAFMMGVPYDDSFIVAELIGTKLFLNEFVAYEKLSKLKENRLKGLIESISVSKCSVSLNIVSVDSQKVQIHEHCKRIWKGDTK